MKTILLILSTTILIGCSSTQIKDRTFDLKVAELIETGYTTDTAVLVSKVELGYIKPNKEYYSIIND